MNNSILGLYEFSFFEQMVELLNIFESIAFSYHRLTSALDSKDFSSSIPLVVELALVSHLCLWSVCRLTMERNPNWNSPSTQHLRLPQLWWNHTTPFLPLTPPWNTLTAPSWWTMRPSMTSVVVTWTLRDQLTPISIV